MSMSMPMPMPVRTREMLMLMTMMQVHHALIILIRPGEHCDPRRGWPALRWLVRRMRAVILAFAVAATTACTREEVHPCRPEPR